MTTQHPNGLREIPDLNDHRFLYANGISVETGLPLCRISTDELEERIRSHPISRDERSLSKKKYDFATIDRLGVIGGVDPNRLSEAGWGVVFHQNADPHIKRALMPLLRLREEQAGARFRIFENTDGYRDGETCAAWLSRHNVSMNPVDPAQGVPFYLLLVGAPEEIPFEFQYFLDIFWAVGRLYFDRIDEYGRYAQSISDYEQGNFLPHDPCAAVFSTRHEFDRASQLFTDNVALPLLKGDDAHGRLGASEGFRTLDYSGDRAAKSSLYQIFRGRVNGSPLAFLLTGTHGLGFGPDDKRLPAMQGALVCQDWRNWGEISREDWFCGQDLPDDASIHGMIHFSYACYSAGCPSADTFADPKTGPPVRIAPTDLIASLPRKQLAHPNGGAMAVLGHVDRTWSYSFLSPTAGPQLQSYRDVIGRILRGERIGRATDQFDVRRAALSFELSEIQRELDRGRHIDHEVLINKWTERNDARSYIILGDPAVRLRVEAFGRSSRPPAGGNTSGRQNDDTSGTHTDESGGDEESRNKSDEAVPFDIGVTPGTSTFDEELKDEWKKHIKKVFERNERMFETIMKSFMEPYWNTVWMYRILFGIGISGFILAIIFGANSNEEMSFLFGGLSVVSFLSAFISRPLQALERNLLIITWLGLVYNTYWMRLSNSLNEPKADKIMTDLQNDLAAQMNQIIDKQKNYPIGAGGGSEEDNKNS